jgi:hypothetical protein
MAAPKGNQFWKLRSKHGRDALFASPELLWEAACEYFEWCDEHPWSTVKFTETDKGGSTESKPTQRPYSRGGLFLYIGCSETWLTNFKKECSIDFLRVIEEIEKVIDTQQWEGATVGVFNSNIIARTLGLKERSESEVSVTGIKPIEWVSSKDVQD